MTSAEEVVRRLFAQQFATMQRQMQSRDTALRQEAGRIATGTVSSATINLDQLAQGGATANQVLAWNSGAGEYQPTTNSATLPWTTAGDIVYYDGSAAQRLAIGTAGQALVVNAGATAPEWDTVLTNPMTTADDIIVGGASGAPARLGVGSNGDVLTVSGGAVGWAAGGGGSGAMTKIASSVLASPGTVSFTGIAGTYFALMIHWIARGNDSANQAEVIEVELNGDTGSNYQTRISQNGGAFSSTSYARGGVMSGSLAPAGLAGTGTIWIPGYANTTFKKQFQQVSGYEGTGSDINTDHGTGWWDSTAAITRVDLLCNIGTQFATGSEFHLYGLS